MKVIPIPAIVAGVIACMLILAGILGKLPWETALAFIAGALVPAIKPADAEPAKEQAK